MAKPSGRDIRHETLVVATDAIKRRGVNGFSFGDLAAQLDVRAPSLHHHFRRKDTLIREATVQYRTVFRADVAAIDAPSPTERIRRYCELFLAPATDGVLCLCGVAIASWDDLDMATQDEIVGFFRDEVHWVAEQFTLAQAAGEIRTDHGPQRLAATLVASLEGALLLARTADDPAEALAAPATLLGLAATRDTQHQ